MFVYLHYGGYICSVNLVTINLQILSQSKTHTHLTKRSRVKLI